MHRRRIAIGLALLLTLTSCGSSSGSRERQLGLLLIAKTVIVFGAAAQSILISAGQTVTYEIRVENPRDVATSFRVQDAGPQDSADALAATKTGASVLRFFDETGTEVDGSDRMLCRDDELRVDCDVLLNPLWSVVVASTWLPAVGLLVNFGLIGSPLGPISGDPFEGEIVTNTVTTEVVDAVPEDCTLAGATMVFITNEGETRVGRVSPEILLFFSYQLFGLALDGRVEIEGTGSLKELRIDVRGLWVRRGQPTPGQLVTTIVVEDGVPRLGSGSIDLGDERLDLVEAPISANGCTPSTFDLDIDIEEFGRTFSLTVGADCRAQLLQEATGQVSRGDAVLVDGQRAYASLTETFGDFTQFWDLVVDLGTGELTGSFVSLRGNEIISERDVTGSVVS